jgi:hypothetical protein
MKIIGCDFHPGYQQIAVLNLATSISALLAGGSGAECGAA